MTALRAPVDDLDRMAELLGRRREPLVEHAPVFWRRADDARTVHRDYLRHLIIDWGARAYRTDEAVLIACPRGDGWLVDDMHVPGTEWATGDGRELWDAFAAESSGNAVRLVCPTYEGARAEFARAVGLTVAESWWLVELAGSGGGVAGEEITLPGADAVTVAAPPVYAPPGPILFLPGPIDEAEAPSVAVERAPGLGCAAVVVNQLAGDDALRNMLVQLGFRQHCDYYTGVVEPTPLT